MNVTLRMVHLVVTISVYLHRAPQHEGKTFQWSRLESDRILEGNKEERGRKEVEDIFNLKKLTVT